MLRSLHFAVRLAERNRHATNRLSVLSCPLSSPLSDVAGSGSRAYFELVVTCIGAMEDAATFRDSYGALSIAISAKRVEVGLLQRFRSICNCFREFPEASAIELESVVSNCQDDANLLLFSMS